MSITNQEEDLTVTGYRNAINSVLGVEPHASNLLRIKSEFPTVRPVHVHALYILGQGEEMRNVCMYVGTTPFLLRQMMAVRDFQQLALTLCPEAFGETEAYTFSTKDQHKIVLEELIKRSLQTIQDRSDDYQNDGPAKHGLLVKRFKSVGGQTVVEWSPDTSLPKEIRESLHMIGEIEGFYKPENDGDTDAGINQMTFEDMTSGIDGSD